MESLSAYARQFLEMMQKPDVEHIDGLSPAISIVPKTTSRTPRSTVASVTEMPVTLQDSPLTFSEKYKRQGRKSVGSSQGMAGALRVIDPSDVPADMRADAQRFAVTVFKALGGEGISRIDFLIDADRNLLFFNEINTLPGSLAFYLWSAAPHYWTITELLARLVARAEHLQAVRNGLQRRPPAELTLLT